MHAVLQYLLNLTNIYRYTGSGTVFVNGTANAVAKYPYEGSGFIYVSGSASCRIKQNYIGSGKIYLYGTAQCIFKPNIGQVIVKFGINEWVYDLQHHIWQITSIYGTPEKIYYVCFNGQYEQVFEENEIIAFADGYKYFSNVYSNQVDSYAETITQIDELIAITPDVEPTPANLVFKFKIGEFVYDANRNIWEVASIEHTPFDIFYNVREPKSGIIATFPEASLLSVEEGASYFDSKYDQQIAEISDKITYIDGLIADTPNIPATPTNLVIKYNIKEFVYDNNKNIWQIVAVENTPSNIQYLAANAGTYKLFDQEMLTDFVGETPYFISKYEEQIASYAEKIAAIEAIINAKFG